MRTIILIILAVFLSCPSYSAPLEILVEKEIDDDTIIITTAKGDRLLLKKWNLRFSPLLFEDKSFLADISANWVTIYFDDREPIKWSIEKTLAGRDTQVSSANQPQELRNSPVYAGTGSGHWIQNVLDNGAIIILEDNSKWQISPIDTVNTGIWLPVTNITVIENNGEFPYRLINADDSETAEAKFLGF